MSSQLLHNLIHWWGEHGPPDVPVLFPGETRNVDELPEWLELWLDAWSDPPARQNVPPRTDVLVTVHCFARPSASLTRCHTLAEAATATLARQLVPLRDYSNSETPVTGHLALYEPETRSLTRAAARAIELPLQHLVVTIPGRVHPAVLSVP